MAVAYRKRTIPIVLPKSCPRCNSKITYADDDGSACAWCGWHGWERATEAVYAPAEIGLKIDERTSWERTVGGEKRETI